MQDTFARARTRPSARATIGYLVYKTCPCLSDSFGFLVKGDQLNELSANVLGNDKLNVSDINVKLIGKNNRKSYQEKY